MSWGERSCKRFSDGTTRGYCLPTLSTCNTRCKLYLSNGKPPDDAPNVVVNEGVAMNKHGEIVEQSDYAMDQWGIREPVIQKVLPDLKKLQVLKDAQAQLNARSAR